MNSGSGLHIVDWNLKMYTSESEPQIVDEAEDHVVVRNLPFERPAEVTYANGPRGVQPNGSELFFPRGYTFGRGAAFVPSFLRLRPVVGPLVGSHVTDDMPVLEPAICYSGRGVKMRNWCWNLIWSGYIHPNPSYWSGKMEWDWIWPRLHFALKVFILEAESETLRVTESSSLI